MRPDELGDYQTPPELASAVVDLVLAGNSYASAIEPTCGRGAFLLALARSARPPKRLVGFELQPVHAHAAREALASARFPGSWTVREGDIFSVDPLVLASGGPDPLLLIGNPPWLATDVLTRRGGVNRPRLRANPQGLAGLDALTGAGGFDIAEAILIRLTEALAERRPTFAFLVKEQTARSFLRYCARAGYPLARASIHLIDARRWFRVDVRACLLQVELAGAPLGVPLVKLDVPVYESITDRREARRIGVRDGELVADVHAYEQTAHITASHGSLPWRQGIKHDAARILELGVLPDGRLVNGLGEQLELERDPLYPLLKSTDLHRLCERAAPQRRLLVTQRSLTESPDRLARETPRAWAYLERHAEAFAARRSRVYAGKSPYAIFGVGDYAFTPFKIAVSGLHAEARFRLVAPLADKPVVFDDTCYYVACADAREAALLWALLCSDTVARQLAALVFPDAKRPLTKRVLARLAPAEALMEKRERERVLARSRRALAVIAPDERIGRDAELLLARIGKRTTPCSRSGRSKVTES